MHNRILSVRLNNGVIVKLILKGNGSEVDWATTSSGFEYKNMIYLCGTYGFVKINPETKEAILLDETDRSNS
jgi:hypothetical protein